LSLIDDSDDWLVKAALRLQEEGDIVGAFHLWQELAQSRPGVAVFYGLATAAKELGEWDEARRSLQRVVELDGEFRPAWVLLHSVAMATGEWEEGEAAARQVLRIEEDAEAHCRLGIALSMLEKDQESRESYLRGIELDPNFQKLYYYFGELLVKSNRTEAEGLFAKAIELDSNDAEAHREMGKILIDEGLLPDAEYHLRRAIELDPADPFARLFLGNLFMWRSEYAAALTEFEWAREAAPDLSAPLWCMADVHTAKEEWAKAEALYHRALDLAPDDAGANKHLGKMYLKMGRADLAKTYLERTLLLQPDDKRAAELLEQTTGEFGDLPNHLVRRLQRGKTRWERRKDPGAP
jgi:tetratricopeptide (TPR) repeat protein